jgi:tetratricopeptide (TPR) repeat protein
MAIKFNDKKAEFYAERGKCFQKMGRLEEALNELNEAIALQQD